MVNLWTMKLMDCNPSNTREIDPLTADFDDGFIAGDLAVLRALIDRHGIEARLLSGSTPLHRAALHSRESNLLDELFVGADLNVRDDTDQSVLHYATMADNIVSTRWIIDHGLDVNIFDGDTTPLHYAAYDDGKTADILLRNGANPDGVSLDSECTPLHNAALTSIECIHLLISYGADINRPDRNGEPPIVYALGLAVEHRRLKPDHVKALLQYEDKLVIKNPYWLGAIDRFKTTDGLA